MNNFLSLLIFPYFSLQLLQLVADQRWVDALQFVRQHRALWLREVSAHTNEDITIILNTYCAYHADKKPGNYYYYYFFFHIYD